MVGTVDALGRRMGVADWGVFSEDWSCGGGRGTGATRHIGDQGSRGSTALDNVQSNLTPRDK